MPLRQVRRVQPVPGQRTGPVALDQQPTVVRQNRDSGANRSTAWEEPTTRVNRSLRAARATCSRSTRARADPQPVRAASRRQAASVDAVTAATIAGNAGNAGNLADSRPVGSPVSITWSTTPNGPRSADQACSSSTPVVPETATVPG